MKKKKPTLPTEGMAFAFPLEDGRFSVCRVLQDATSEHAKQIKSKVILVACSAWIGDKIPDVQDPVLRPILQLTHHSWNDPHVLWIGESPPDDFIPIGIIKPTEEEQATICLTYGTWGSVRCQPLDQWQWDHDRDSVLTRDAIAEKEEVKQCKNARQARDVYLAGITLEELRDRQFFPDWKEYPPRKAILASRKIMANTVQQLLELGPNASEAQRMSILQQCIESFNTIDVEMGNFIETIEREDILKEFEAIVHACGFGNHENLADQWREW